MENRKNWNTFIYSRELIIRTAQKILWKIYMYMYIMTKKKKKKSKSLVCEIEVFPQSAYHWVQRVTRE